MKQKSLLINNVRGFSLVEILLAIVLIGLVGSIGVSSFLRYSRYQIFNQATNDFINTLNTAKANAASQVKPSVATCNNFSLDGYQLRTFQQVAPNRDYYRLYVVCSGTAHQLSQINLPDASFTITNNGSITFQVLTGTVSGNNTITITGFGNSRTINISAVGVIN